MWREALAGVEPGLESQVEAIVEQFDFGPEAIARAVAAARNRARLRRPAGAGCTRPAWRA